MDFVRRTKPDIKRVMSHWGILCGVSVLYAWAFPRVQESRSDTTAE